MSGVNPVLSGSVQGIAAYQDAVEQSMQAAVEWSKQPEMYQGKTAKQLHERINLNLTSQGLSSQAAIERAVEYFLKDSLLIYHARCVVRLHCPNLVMSQAAEVLINAIDQSMGSWDQSPSATIIETELIEWLRKQVGYPADDAGVFINDGTQNSLMGLTLARDVFLARQGRSIQQDGPIGDLSKIKVLCSESAHFSVQKDMALMRLGYRSVTRVRTDAFSCMDLTDLKDRLTQTKANGEQVMTVIVTAGTADTGAVDPLADITALAAEHQIWMHVNAAWGGALLLSEKYHDFLNSLELVDSVTLDFHKQFFQTISCGTFLLKDARHCELMRYQAAYLNSDFDEEAGVLSLVSKSLQTTRRFDALKLWMGPEALDRKQHIEIIDNGVMLTRDVAEFVETQSYLELVMELQLADVPFRFHPQNDDVAFVALLNRCVSDVLLASGSANVGVIESDGVTCLKLTLLNLTVCLEDVKVLLASVKATAERLLST